MKFTIVALATFTGIASAQVVFDNTTSTFQCLGPAAGKDFCAGDSLETNIIIRCSGTTGQPGNCNDNLNGVSPVGVKSSALCYQTSNTTGDAACSFNGIAYPDSGAPFSIPGASSSSSASSTSTVYVSSSSSSAAVYTTIATTSTTAAVYTTSTPGSIVYVTGTTTVSTCTTSASSPTYPAGNSTGYTSSPTPPPPATNAAGSVGIQGGLFAGLLAFAGALLL